MANSNNICTRFINYVAVLILVFLSSQIFAAGGSFGGAGAGGSWDEPQKCGTYMVSDGVPIYGSTPQEACSKLAQSFNKTLSNNGQHTYSLTSSSGGYCQIKRSDGANLPPFNINGGTPCSCPVGYDLTDGKCQPKNVLWVKRL